MKNIGKNNRPATGLLLLLLFALPPVVRTVHIWQYVYVYETCCDHENNHNHRCHDCDNCAICQFVVFPFTDTPSNDSVGTTATDYFKPCIYQECILACIICWHMLRAPPQV